MEVGAEVCAFWILGPKGRCVCVCHETKGRRYVGDSQILGYLFFGVAITKIRVFLGLQWASPMQWHHHMAPQIINPQTLSP